MTARVGMSRLFGAIVSTMAFPALAAADVWTDAKHGTVDSGGVKIHYADAGFGAARRDDPRLPGLLVLVATPDGGAGRPLSGGGDRSARLQPERQAGRAGAVRHVAARRRRQGGRPATREGAEGDHRRPRLGRHGRVELRDAAPRAHRAADRPEPAAPARPGSRARDTTRSSSRIRHTRAASRSRTRRKR